VAPEAASDLFDALALGQQQLQRISVHRLDPFFL
jgi:hypothetical protein